MKSQFWFSIRQAKNPLRRSSARRKSRRRHGRRLWLERLESRSLLVGDVAGTVFHDVNNNGVKNPEEDGLPGWTVFLDVNKNGTLDAGEPSQVTDVDGDYLIEGVPAVTYTIREILKPGWSPSTGFSDHRQVTVIDEDEVKVNFGNYIRQIGTITGTVWNDFNGDGIRAAGDVGLADWTVFLDVNRNNAFDTDLNGDGIANDPEPSQLTDAAGEYTFVGVAAGSQRVGEVLPAGWETPEGFDTHREVFVTTGGTSIADFANFTPEASSISGTVWNDLDGDGHRAENAATGEFTEPGIAGWTVFADLDGNGLLDATDRSDTTAADGSYTLSGVPHGQRSLISIVQADWRATAPASGRYTVQVLNGVTLDGYDFGNQERREASISGRLYVDADHDGTRDAGERGLAGIVVYLDLDNDDVLDDDEPRTTSSADLYFTPAVDETGEYRFTHLARGTYYIREIVPDDLSSTPEIEREHVVTLGGAEDRRDVDAGNVFRPNEIHGVKIDDRDGDHSRDTDEPGIGGVTIFLDLDRDNVLDDGEPQTLTAADGSYTFTGLSPDVYIVREVVSDGSFLTFPTTLGGIYWPSGESHAAVGRVSPMAITASLATGESLTQRVSLTLPDAGALTNLVDVFLLFDDTGSFTSNSPIVRAAFPSIITALQSRLPGIDLGFGVGRLEEYGGFAGENAQGRPFVLNHPIVAASTPGYLDAIQAALDRTAPGFGGDQPETLIEALYQTVTGLGFDGNNNGAVLDSGPAGKATTQTLPGNSGDVPPFASFAADPSGSVLPAAGNLGGAGFRAGALPVILAATDTGTAYQPKGETTITGISGLTLPLADFTQTSRPTAPFPYAAGIQETITGLNALGALVIGLGTNAEATLDPRRDLEAIARLTGATNQSAITIANGTTDPIAPGDPFYFRIASGFADSVANGVVNAIENAATNVAVNISLKASDPRVRLINHTGVRTAIGAGQTAAFDIEFIGDGRPHRFDLQFIREGTSVVLGSIPVVLGTPIPGDGFEFEDLDEGEFGQAVDFGNHDGSSGIVNSPPVFVKGVDVTIAEDAGWQSVPGWATGIRPGPASDTGQEVDFVVHTDNAALFEHLPAIAADGALTFQFAGDAVGVATVTVRLHDDGGTDGGGIDISPSQSFTITATPVNDPPVAFDDTFAIDEDMPLVLDSPGILSNDRDIDGDTLMVSLVSPPQHGSLELGSNGSVRYQPAANFYGNDEFQYRVSDGQVDSLVATVTITVQPVNDPPTPAAVGPIAIDAGMDLPVDASPTTDLEGDSLLDFAWDFNRDGTADWTTDHAVDRIPWSVLTSAGLGGGSHTVGLTVRDVHGAVGAATVTIDISDRFVFATNADGAADEIALSHAGGRYEIRAGLSGNLLTAAVETGIQHVQIDGSTDDDTLLLDARTAGPLPPHGLQFQAGDGQDTVLVAGHGLSLDLLSPQGIQLAGVETINVCGDGANGLNLDFAAVMAATDATHELTVLADGDDAVSVGAGWQLDQRLFVGDQYFHVLRQQDATIWLTPPHPWRNSAVPADIDANGHVEPLDAILLINRINGAEPSDLPALSPESPPAFFFDADGDNHVFAADVLVVVNAANTAIESTYAAASGEGELLPLATPPANPPWPTTSQYTAGADDESQIWISNSIPSASSDRQPAPLTVRVATPSSPPQNLSARRMNHELVDAILAEWSTGSGAFDSPFDVA